MDCDSHSSSDLDDELPTFDFLSQTTLRHKSRLDASAANFSSVKSDVGMQKGTDVMMASSASDDEAPYVPLAQRLKQRQPCRNLTTEHTEPQPLSSRSLPKRKYEMCTVEAIQTSKEEALKRRKAREGVQQDKNLLRQEKEREKSERKDLAEAAKTLRPEEYIKYMVVVVDPGEQFQS